MPLFNKNILIDIMEQKFNLIKCPKCMNQVDKKKFIIHDSKCKGDLAGSKIESKIYIQRKKKIFQKRKQVQEQEQIVQQTFPCSLCSYPMKITQFDKHPQECPGKLNQCQYCNISYPHQLIEQHHLVCPSRNPRPLRIYGRSHSRQLFEQQQEDEENMGPMRNIFNLIRLASSNRPRNRLVFQQDQGMHRSIQLGDLIRRLLLSEQFEVNNGLTKNQIKSLQKIRYQQTQEEELCTICYCNFEDKQEIIKLKCKHLYHNDCIQKWLSENPLCPVCKTNLKTK